MAPVMNIATLPGTSAVKPVNKRVGRNVRYIMSERGVNQVELALKLGLTESQVSRRLTGKVDWTPDDLVQTASVLRVEIGLLFNLQLPHLDSNQEPIGFQPLPANVTRVFFHPAPSVDADKHGVLTHVDFGKTV